MEAQWACVEVAVWQVPRATFNRCSRRARQGKGQARVPGGTRVAPAIPDSESSTTILETPNRVHYFVQHCKKDRLRPTAVKDQGTGTSRVTPEVGRLSQKPTRKHKIEILWLCRPLKQKATTSVKEQETQHLQYHQHQYNDSTHQKYSTLLVSNLIMGVKQENTINTTTPPLNKSGTSIPHHLHYQQYSSSSSYRSDYHTFGFATASAMRSTPPSTTQCGPG